MKKIFGVIAVFVVVVLGFQQGASYFSRRAEEKRNNPVIITGSYSDEVPPKTDAPSYQVIEWEKLMPPDWNPVKVTGDLEIANLEDNDPRAVEALKKTVEAWKDAPVNPALHGKPVRIAGFVVPLEHHGNALKAFLLVPYYGACIHTPPPPSNQIILVRLAKPAGNVRAMDAVWVSGEMTVEQKTTVLGVSGYAMQGVDIAPYVEESRPQTGERG